MPKNLVSTASRKDSLFLRYLNLMHFPNDRNSQSLKIILHINPNLTSADNLFKKTIVVKIRITNFSDSAAKNISMSEAKKIRVLVTGGTGLVGKGIEWNHKNKPKYPDAEFIFLSSKDADLRDLASTRACFEKHKPTHVIHLAAIVVTRTIFNIIIFHFLK